MLKPIGEKEETMYDVRCLLANISPVFGAQFNGSFAESNLDSTIKHPTINPAVFRCIIRASFALDPNISGDTAIPLLLASQMLQIDALVVESQLQKRIGKGTINVFCVSTF